MPINHHPGGQNDVVERQGNDRRAENQQEQRQKEELLLEIEEDRLRRVLEASALPDGVRIDSNDPQAAGDAAIVASTNGVDVEVGVPSRLAEGRRRVVEQGAKVCRALDVDPTFVKCRADWIGPVIALDVAGDHAGYHTHGNDDGVSGGRVSELHADHVPNQQSQLVQRVASQGAFKYRHPGPSRPDEDAGLGGRPPAFGDYYVVEEAVDREQESEAEPPRRFREIGVLGWREVQHPPPSGREVADQLSRGQAHSLWNQRAKELVVGQVVPGTGRRGGIRLLVPDEDAG